MTTADQIIQEIKNGKFFPVYFFYGEEPYYIDLLSNYIENNILSESERSFNLQVFYGKDANPVSVVESARRFPMMAKYQIIILREAQELNKTEELTEYIKHPSASTIFVVNYKYKKIDRRTKLYQVLQSEYCLLFESKKLYENKIPEWIIQYLAKKNRSIDLTAAMLLTEYVGNSLSNVVNELEKLLVSLPGDEKKIMAEHIEKYIGFSKDYNNFELQKSLISRDILKANRIMANFCKNPNNHPFLLTITYLYYFFSKLLVYHTIRKQPKAKIASVLKLLREYFVNDYAKAALKYPFPKVVSVISLLRDMDVKSKGIGNVSSSDCDLLKELIFKILH